MLTNVSNVSLGEAAATALLGYGVVFLGLVLLMIVVVIMGKIMSAKKAPAAEAAPVAAPTPAGEPAPGSAGPLKLYDTPPRDAAMCMAIVANQLGKPLNELRFISIKEVK